MSWSILGTILGGVDLVALLGILLYYKPNKEAKQIENTTHGNEALQSVIATLREELERSDLDSKNKQDAIDALRELLLEKEKTIYELEKRLAQAEFENTKNCFWKCEVKGCLQRIPPNGL